MKESESLGNVETWLNRAEQRLCQHVSNDALRVARDSLRRIGHMIAAERLRAELDEDGDGGHPLSFSTLIRSDLATVA
jgi:hypothetical protein